MREDMRNHRDGVVTFSAVNGMELILSYNAMQAFDWVLLTLVPADLIVSEVNEHISRMFRIVVGMIWFRSCFLWRFYEPTGTIAGNWNGLLLWIPSPEG